jgi:hypothetical protein
VVPNAEGVRQNETGHRKQRAAKSAATQSPASSPIAASAESVSAAGKWGSERAPARDAKETRNTTAPALTREDNGAQDAMIQLARLLARQTIAESVRDSGGASEEPAGGPDTNPPPAPKPFRNQY